MRTNIVIDDKLMAEALRVSGAKTKKEVVELGLKTLLQLKRQSEVRRLRAWLRQPCSREAPGPRSTGTTTRARGAR